MFFFLNIIALDLKVSCVALNKSKVVETKLASFRTPTIKESLPDLDLKNGMAKRCCQNNQKFQIIEKYYYI